MTDAFREGHARPEHELEFRPHRPYDQQRPTTILVVRPDGTQTLACTTDYALSGAMEREVLASHGVILGGATLRP